MSNIEDDRASFSVGPPDAKLNKMTMNKIQIINFEAFITPPPLILTVLHNSAGISLSHWSAKTLAEPRLKSFLKKAEDTLAAKVICEAS